MKFEYDPNKSAANKEKHGIDFEEAQELWNDGRALEIEAAYKDERRFALLGRLQDLHWTAVYTYRGECIRLISCRRSRKQEVQLYEQQ